MSNVRTARTERLVLRADHLEQMSIAVGRYNLYEYRLIECVRQAEHEPEIGTVSIHRRKQRKKTDSLFTVRFEWLCKLQIDGLNPGGRHDVEHVNVRGREAEQQVGQAAIEQLSLQRGHIARLRWKL